MKVCIAEKQSVAKEIAAILGAQNRKDGYFEGNGYQVTWTFGHFCTLYTPDDYQQSWKKWSLYNLPMLPDKFETKLLKNDGVVKQFGVIKKLFDQANLVINCGDAGQEGELIQRWVIKHTNYKGKVLRLWISSLTSEAIKAGFSQLKQSEDYDNLYYAGSSRAIGDWLLGMNATRLYTLKYGGYKQVLSIGRVQTPTLAMLVDRNKEIVNFEPKTYWELQTLYRETLFNCEEGKFERKEDGEKLLKQIAGEKLEILSVSKKKGKEQPPRLFDLTGLQVHCNKKFGYTAEQTLQLIQKLYDQKLVTYPRVDTTFLPNDVYPKINEILEKLKKYSKFTQPLIGKKIRKSTKVFNDKKVTDHHAIIPTGIESNLSGDLGNVYDAITRQFLAAFYPDCLVSNTLVSAIVDDVKFKTKGKEILEEGWRSLFPKSKKNKAEESEKLDKKEDEIKILPTFIKGESGEHTPSFLEKQTKPPKTYTEATLLRAMETAGKKVENEELRELMKENGIGRPSTRANIIETLAKRKYIERKKKQILATETGIQLINTIQNKLLKSAELTGRWEKQLKEIEQGKFSARRFIVNMKKMVSDLVQEVKTAKNQPKISAIKERAEIDSKKSKMTNTKVNDLTNSDCPLCKKGKLLKGKTGYGCSRWKEDCSFLIPFEFMNKKISEKQLERLLLKGSTVLLKGFMLNDVKVNGILSFNDKFQISFEEKSSKTKVKEIKQPLCPKCNTGFVIKGQTAYGCSNWKNGCTFRFTFEEVRKKAKGKKISKELVSKILNDFT